MLDFRSPVMLAAGPLGLVLACLAWLLGGSGRVLGPVEAAEARLQAMPIVRVAPATPAEVASATGGSPFSGSGPASLRLDGLSRTARRTAALVSINGGPAQWLPLGATVDGVTLVDVLASKVVVETMVGRRALALGETAADLGGEAASAVVITQDQPPPGMRTGVPPASAPSMP